MVMHESQQTAKQLVSLLFKWWEDLPTDDAGCLVSTPGQKAVLTRKHRYIQRALEREGSSLTAEQYIYNCSQP
jgi:hypothetical protein